MERVDQRVQQPVELCEFCDLLEEPKSAFDVCQPLGDTDVLLKPALGMFTPGYFLTVAGEHITSFANMKDELRAIDIALTEVERSLGPVFGQYFRFESGSDNIASCGGSGSCIVHAHHHLIPSAEYAGAYILDQDIGWHMLDTYEDVADFQGKPYAYLGIYNCHFVAPEPNLPGQWARRKVAEVMDIPHWDWSVYPGNAELALTLRGLASVNGFGAFKESPLMQEHLQEYDPADGAEE